ncbi:epoxide hydrolase N-terminal domain-containing protein [Streptomyces aurantiacus]|uniref:epoxide hydrolase N-terminal domain-containing protein n=1 Tax=Streptomyces aurantiacus TaxID=47760 RepID=UPI0006E143DD|nr:epoxide hydrolase N-terminal domain-containing protein [Streptomyces aurantiacus]
MPQLVAELDGLGIHFVHRRGTGPAPYPLVIMHGWPGSGFDMEKITPLLADPGGHGADPADAFDVVVPSPPPPFPDTDSRSGRIARESVRNTRPDCGRS